MGGGTTDGGGFPGLDGGGLLGCDVASPNACPGTDCCDGIASLGIGICVSAGGTCQLAPTPFVGGICNGVTKTCQ